LLLKLLLNWLPLLKRHCSCRHALEELLPKPTAAEEVIAGRRDVTDMADDVVDPLKAL
jgi:hypothetical protein